MSKTVDFIFDFGSPNAYLAYPVVSEICQRSGAQLNVVPVLLGGIFKLTGNRPPMMAFGDIKGKLDYERLEMKRFIKKHGLIRFKMNSHFPVNTLLMMRAAIVAQNDNKLDEYIHAGLAAMWEDDQKMDDPEVFVQVMNEAGLDGRDLLDKTSDPAVKATLMANTQGAVDRGAFGIPTFYVGDEMFFGKDRLIQVEQAVL